MNTTEIITNNQTQTVSDTVSLNINQWVNEARTHSQLIAGYTKEMEHWQKRELESAIICGTNLAKIRQSYGDRGIGFKPFIEKEFANEFSYKTCLRYMKLANRSSEIPSDVSNIRQAYIRLGILQEDYSYPKPESNHSNNSGTNANNKNGLPKDPSTNSGTNYNASNGPSEDKSTKTKPRSSKRTLTDLLPYGDSIFMTYKEDKKNDKDDYEVCEFNLNPEGILSGRLVFKSINYGIVKPAGIEMFIKKLTPYVEWYLRQTSNNVSLFPAPAKTETAVAA
jgi:hypothetical protein